MNRTEVIKNLKEHQSDSYRKILMNHGASDPVLGVKISDLKGLQKQIKKDYPLALELYNTGIYDAQYLAGLITDDSKMTKKNLRDWIAKANCTVISGTVVAWVAAESRYGSELADRWVQSKKEEIAQAGWMTLCSLAAIKEDSELDIPEWQRLLELVEQSIQKQTNLVRYAMNEFVIAVGCSIEPLHEIAIASANKIGSVSVDMGNTACQVPSAVDAINKTQQRGKVGKKRKTAKC